MVGKLPQPLSFGCRVDNGQHLEGISILAQQYSSLVQTGAVRLRAPLFYNFAITNS